MLSGEMYPTYEGRPLQASRVAGEEERQPCDILATAAFCRHITSQKPIPASGSRASVGREAQKPTERCCVLAANRLCVMACG